ncbi:CU044_2847 family protein [Streptomyces sp. NPDC089799]|uniref:CU044_2847 family protein n=1 Tax=Streptomyces sp. NPDC089799 TaxID=3155066 RepID=UPI003413927C
MASLTRVPLDGGGWILVEQPDGPVGEGALEEGRLGAAVQDLPHTLREALEPVTEAARIALDQLRKARPDEITVEFGLDLAVEAGVVITRSRANCHLNVSMRWKHETAHPHRPADPPDPRSDPPSDPPSDPQYDPQSDPQSDRRSDAQSG